MATAPSDSVDFIDEDQAGRVLAGLLEHVANAAGAYTNEHFNEIRTADAEESSVGLAGDGFGEESFAGSRRTNHEDALWNAAAEALKFLRVFEELDKFGDFLDGFIDASDIFEGGFVAFLGKEAGFTLAEAQGSFASHFDLADEEEPD
jgi:hypothetical protein